MEEKVSSSEEFKPCVSYNAYEVSLDGRVRVRSTKKLAKVVTLNKVNYVVIKIGMYSEKGKAKGNIKKTKTIKVSEMIARTYLKKKKDDLLRCINGNWNDYSLANYEWYNPRELPENKIGKWRKTDISSAYEVSSDGRVRKYKDCKPLKIYSNNGRAFVTLRVYGESKNVSVARLVAFAFLGKPKEKPISRRKANMTEIVPSLPDGTEVSNGSTKGKSGKHHIIIGHKDGDPWNNNVNNLVYGMRDHTNSNNLIKRSKPVDEYSLDGEFLGTWSSMTAAARKYRLSTISIKSTCIGKYMSAANRVWRFKGEPFDKHKVPEKVILFPGEVFKPIPKSYAEVSNYGRIINTYNGRKFYKVKEDGTVKLKIDGKITNKKVYILEANAWLDNPNGCTSVGFIDGDRTNWKAENLKWIGKGKNNKKNKKEGTK